jgi:hypothetical protein
MRYLMSIIALVLAGLGLHAASPVEAASCQWSTTRYTATVRCTGTAPYRACLQSSYYITYCGPWRTSYYASTASVPCCDSNHYRISHWVDW